MVDPAAVLAAEPAVERRNPGMLEERAEIRARAKCFDPQIGAIARLAACLPVSARDRLRLRPFPHRELRLGIDDVLLHVADETLERVRSAHAEKAAAVSIRVEVEHRLLRELLRVRLHPFGGAEQRRLLAVPRGVDERALRLPSLLHELAHRARFLELRDEAGERVFRAVHPAVVMVAAHDPLIGILRTRNLRDHIVDRFETPVERELQVHARRTGAEAISDRQRTAPSLGRDKSRHRREQRLRVAVRNGEHRDLHDRGGVLAVETHRVLRRADARSERIAGIHGHVHHAAALHAVFRAERTVGIDLSLRVAVVLRVGIDQATHRAVLVRDLRLDAAPRAAIAHDDDRALHGNPTAIQLVVVCRYAVVRIDQRRGHVAVGRVRVVGRKLLAFLAARRILRKRRFFELRRELHRRDHLEEAFLRRREQHLELLDVRVPSVRPELVAQPLGVVLVVRRSDVMRSRRKAAQRFAHPAGLRDRAELGLPVSLDLGGLDRVAAHLAVLAGRRGQKN